MTLEDELREECEERENVATPAINVVKESTPVNWPSCIVQIVGYVCFAFCFACCCGAFK